MDTTNAPYPFLYETVNFQNHPEWTRVYDLYSHLLRALGAVHEVGRVKYSEFGWIRDPHAPNASTEESINAMMRHIVSLRSRCITDTEGFSHLYHIACRGGMLLTKFYMESLYQRPCVSRQCTIKAILDIREILPLVRQTDVDGRDTSSCVFMVHATNEEYLSMLKIARLDKESHCVEKLHRIIQTMAEQETHPEATTDFLLDLILLYLNRFTEEYLNTKSQPPRGPLTQEEWDIAVTSVWTVDYLFLLIALLLQYVEQDTSGYFDQWKDTDEAIIRRLQARHDAKHNAAMNK